MMSIIRKIIKNKHTHRIGCCLILFFILMNNGLYAQDAIQFSQYFSNQLAINPAYAGADDALSLTMVHRNQWTGVNGAPRTTTLSGHTLFKNENTGIGVSLFVDEINIHSNVSFSGIYSYRIKLGKASYLSMGLQAGINYAKSDYASLTSTIFDPNDPGLLFEKQSESAFQFGTGLYFKSSKLEVGISAPVLYSSKSSSSQDSTRITGRSPHYFMLTRYKIQLSHNIQLNPGFLLKSRIGNPLAIDLNLETVINEVLMLGLSYRSFESLCAILQMKILPQMKFGYSYDIPLSTIQRSYFNSHELMLNYVFKYKNYNVKSPR